jgi:hypothetical protein
VGCIPVQVAPTTPRDFTTTDLIVVESRLPDGLRFVNEPTKARPSDFGASGGVDASRIEFRGAASGFHVVVQLGTARDAQLAYEGHAFTTDDTRGRYGTTWSPMSGFNYQSPLADQFRVVCGATRNIAFQIPHCFIEAQYDEFLSLVSYDTLDTGRVLTDLESLARAVDDQFAHHLKEDLSK